MVYPIHYHPPNSQGGKISITKSLLLLFLSSLFINLGREEPGKQKCQVGQLEVHDGQSLPAHHSPKETFLDKHEDSRWLVCFLLQLPLLCKKSQLSKLKNSPTFSAVSSLNMWAMQQQRVAIKRIPIYFCLSCWNNLYRKLTPGSFGPVLITHQFRVHLWFQFTDGADFRERNLACIPWKVVLGKMHFGN